MQEDPSSKRPSTYPIFSKHLILQPNSVLQFANQSRKQFEDFIQAFRRRIVVQTDYANSLIAVSRSLDKYIQRRSDKTVSFICSAFQVENEQRAHQARQLADTLKTEIYEICQNLSRQESNVIKKAQKQVKNLIRRFESVNQNLKLSEVNYEKSSQKYDQLIITKSYLTQTNTIAPDRKSKMLSRNNSSINEHKQLQRQYVSNIKQYNEFAQDYNRLICQTLNEVQTQVREHLVLESDCLRKLIVAQVSMFKNIEYDLINISKQMEGLDTQKDIEIACNQCKLQQQHLIVDLNQDSTASESPKQKDKKTSASFILNEKDLPKKLQPSPIQLTKGMMATSILNIEEDRFTQLILHKKSQPFKDLILLRWKLLNSKNQHQQKQHKQNLTHTFEEYLVASACCQQLINTKKEEQRSDTKIQIQQNFIIITRFIHEVWTGAKITPIESRKKSKTSQSTKDSVLNYVKKLFSLSHFYRLVAYSFIECFRTNHYVQIDSQQKIHEIAKFLNVLLTKSYKENDVFVLRGLLFLLFTFYYIENNAKRHMASEPSIYKNSLWKKSDFWDAAIFESTYEQMLNFSPQNESLLQNSVTQKNLLFSQLAMFCHYMIMLGISSQNVREIVGRFCKLYSMTDQQNRDLSKMITNTVKQYRQIILVNLKNNHKGQKDSKQQKYQEKY